MRIHSRGKGIDGSIISGRKKGESTTLINKEDRSRRRSGGKSKLVKKEACIAHRVWTLCGLFKGDNIRVFLFSKRCEIIKKKISDRILIRLDGPSSRSDRIRVNVRVGLFYRIRIELIL